MPAVDKLDMLLKARQQFAYGDQQDYLDHPNCIAWVRSGDGEHPGCITVVSNGQEGFKDINLGEDKKGWVYVDFLGRYPHEIILDEHGTGRFLAQAGSVSVWVPKQG